MTGKTKAPTKKPPKKKTKPANPSGHITLMKSLLTSKKVTKGKDVSMKSFLASLALSDQKTHELFLVEHKEYHDREARETFSVEDVFHAEVL
tara:strand:- start:134 stop:409 length:276 start_codon:yes stop_codon:yes gene_type:complete